MEQQAPPRTTRRAPRAGPFGSRAGAGGTGAGGDAAGVVAPGDLVAIEVEARERDEPARPLVRLIATAHDEGPGRHVDHTGRRPTVGAEGQDGKEERVRPHRI